MKFAHCLFGAFLQLLSSTFVVPSIIEGDLINALFENYSATIRPVDNPHKSINVTLNIRFVKILSINEQEQKITAKFYFYMTWKNDLLKWDPQEWHGINLLRVMPNKVWIPSLVLKNNAKSDGKSVNIQEGTDMVAMEPNGGHSWYPAVVYTSSIKIIKEYFPFDQQNFSLTFISWNYHREEINILADNNISLIDQHYESSSEWGISTHTRKVIPVYYDGFSDPYMHIMFSFIILRKPLFYLGNTVVPCVILTVIILFSYFLPASSGERMGVLITVLLAFAVFLEIITASLPPNSDSTSVLSMFFVATMSLAAFSMFSTCIVITILHKENKGTPPPNWVRRYILKNIPRKNADISLNAYDNLDNKECEGASLKYHQGSNTDIITRMYTEPKDLTPYLKISLQKQDEHSRKMSMIMKKLDEILRITSTVTKQKVEAEEIESEWSRLAIMVDRISLCIFLCLNVASLGIIYYGYSRYDRSAIEH